LLLLVSFSCGLLVVSIGSLKSLLDDDSEAKYREVLRPSPAEDSTNAGHGVTTAAAAAAVLQESAAANAPIPTAADAKEAGADLCLFARGVLIAPVGRDSSFLAMPRRGDRRTADRVIIACALVGRRNGEYEYSSSRCVVSKKGNEWEKSGRKGAPIQANAKKRRQT
jgi:hypothetical protein